MNHSPVLVSGQILQIYKSEKFFKSHIVLEGIGERRGGGGGVHLKVTQTGTLVV